MILGPVPIVPIGGISGGAANAAASTQSLTAGKFKIVLFERQA